MDSMPFTPMRIRLVRLTKRAQSHCPGKPSIWQNGMEPAQPGAVR
jgi:hypothetical protein